MKINLLPQAKKVWTAQQKGTSADGATTAETYAYSYDKAGRLTGSLRYIDTSTSAVNTLTEQSITYDRSGNLLSLNRYGASSGTTPSESLSFSYTGPKRTGWGYDSHGNVTSDPASITTVTWNVLDMPRTLTSSSTGTQRSYLADGTLVQVNDGSTTRLYLGDMIFNQTSGTISLESAAWDGGLLLPGNGTDKVLYYVTDHLGSVRVVKDGAGNIRQRYDYYPYGSVTRNWSSSSTSTPDKRYRFGGKEIAGTALGVLSSGSDKYLDFGARLYSPGTAMWLSQDPMAEKYYPLTPYMYCAGSPGNVVDPEGLTNFMVNGDLRTINDGFHITLWVTPEEFDKLSGYFELTPFSEYYPFLENLMKLSSYMNEEGLFVIPPSYCYGDGPISSYSATDMAVSLSSAFAGLSASILYSRESGLWFGGKKLHGKSFYGNQHTWLQKDVIKASKALKITGNAISGLGLVWATYDLLEANNEKQMIEASTDLFIGAMGFIPEVGPFITLYWTLGGRRLFYQYNNTVIKSQIETGVIGYPATLPFK